MVISKIFENVFKKINDLQNVDSFDTKKIDKRLKKGKEINVGLLTSKRYKTKGSNGHFSDDDAKTSLDEYDGETEVDVKSTAVQDVRYVPNKNNPSEGVCYVLFVDGDKWYRYEHMSPRQFKTFMDASSKGRYVNKVMHFKNYADGYK